MNERINFLVITLGIKKTEFAKRLKLSQPFVSELCSGKSNPSDRTILDICREFDVNEMWLRYGEGEMFKQKNPNEEIESFMLNILRGDENFKRKIVRVIARMSEDEWEMLERKIKEIMGEP